MNKATVILFFILALAVSPMRGTAAQEEKVSMDFVNVDIAVVVKYISELTGKNFIIDEKVQGKVTIISPRKVGKKEAYTVFESILEVYGFTAIPSGNLIKIVPVNEARLKGGAVRVEVPKFESRRDRMVTQLIPLKYVPAEKMVAVLRPLIPPTSYLTSYQPSNTIIIVDMAANLSRLMKIVNKLDLEGVEKMVKVRRLNHASAKSLAPKITKAMQIRETAQKGKKAGGKPFSVIAEERINALIIVGNDYYMKNIEDLVDTLDVEAPPGRDEVNVVYLKNADAADMEKVLSQLAETDTIKGKGKDPKTAAKRKSDVTVTADKSTNSLVITASPEQFATLKKVIDKLDIRRRQVFVEALIFEIRSDKTSQFGVEWRTTSNFTEDGVQGIGGTNFGNISNMANNPLTAAGAGLVLGVVDGTINYRGEDYVNIGGLISALATDADANILSTPNLLTTDNKEAEIFVGENVPFITSTTESTGGSTIQNIERKDVGVKLKITPQINEDDFVKLDIYQEISNISTTQLDKAKDIQTFERWARTTVTVKDGQNIIIGGLIQDDKVEAVSKVPLLGDIPILGWLFKSKSTKTFKKNLFIFLTPHIINNPDDLQKLTGEKNREMQEKSGAAPEETPKEQGESPGEKPEIGFGDSSGDEVVLFTSENEDARLLWKH